MSLSNEAGKEYGTPRNFSGFDEVGATLRREAGVTHQQLQVRYPRYERGEELRLSLDPYFHFELQLQTFGRSSSSMFM